MNHLPKNTHPLGDHPTRRPRDDRDDRDHCDDRDHPPPTPRLPGMAISVVFEFLFQSDNLYVIM